MVYKSFKTAFMVPSISASRDLHDRFIKAFIKVVIKALSKVHESVRELYKSFSESFERTSRELYESYGRFMGALLRL